MHRHQRQQRPHQVLAKQHDHQREQQVELLLQRQAPVHETGAIFVMIKTVGKAEIGVLRNAGQGRLKVRVQGAERAGAVEKKTRQQHQRQPQPGRRQQSKGPAQPEIARLLPILLARCAAAHGRDQAAGNDETRDREKQIHAPPRLAVQRDGLQQRHGRREQAVLQVMKQHAKHRNAAQQLDVHDPFFVAHAPSWT
ncbi:hypothetical protein D3C78_788740 [compost metagenome]